MSAANRLEEGSCRHARWTVSAALDGEASVPDLVEAAGHLGRCARCRTFTRQLAAATRVLRGSARTRHPAVIGVSAPTSIVDTNESRTGRLGKRRSET